MSYTSSDKNITIVTKSDGSETAANGRDDQPLTWPKITRNGGKNRIINKKLTHRKCGDEVVSICGLSSLLDAL